MTEVLYTRNQVEEIATKVVKEIISSMLNLDNKIGQGGKGENMPSNYRETYYYPDNEGNVIPIRINGLSKKDTDSKFMEFLRRKNTGPKLKDFVNNTYRENFMRKLSPTTKASYNNYLDRYILPNLGNKHLGEITVIDVQKLYDWMASAGKHGCRNDLNSDTIKRVSGLLNRLYRIAIDLNLVTENPIKKTLLSNEGAKSSHHKALPDSEVARIKKEINFLENDMQRLYMGLLVYTGMRREEIAGIGWEHIHMEDRYGEIKRVVIYPNGKHAVIRDKTKTKYSTREFIISEPLAEILKPFVKKTGFIIHGRDESKPVPLSTLKRIYLNAFKILNINGYDNHDWRATFGTQLKDAGISSAQVADLMGHADTRMVETTYAPTRHESIMKHKNTLNKINMVPEDFHQSL